jgi:hypothetical protein
MLCPGESGGICSLALEGWNCLWSMVWLVQKGGGHLLQLESIMVPELLPFPQPQAGIVERLWFVERTPA